MSKYPYRVVYHLGCGKIAFYIDNEYPHGKPMKANEVFYPDGTNPQPGQNVICGSCKKIMSYWKLERNDDYIEDDIVEPELMTLQEAVFKMNDGDKFMNIDPNKPDDNSTAINRCGLFYWESNGKEIGLSTDVLKMKGRIIPTEPKVLDETEAFETFMEDDLPDKFYNNSFFESGFRTGFSKGDQNGQLREYLRPEQVELRKAVEEFSVNSNPKTLKRVFIAIGNLKPPHQQEEK